MRDLIVTVIISILGGGSFFAFLQFMINRKDNKEDKKNEILDEVKQTRKEVSNFKSEVELRFDKVERKIDDNEAKQSRVRILRFFDEVQSGHLFSKDAWVQTKEDIMDYEKHCEDHDDFPNSKAEDAITTLKTLHKELLEKERMGELVFRNSRG